MTPEQKTYLHALFEQVVNTDGATRQALIDNNDELLRSNPSFDLATAQVERAQIRVRRFEGLLRAVRAMQETSEDDTTDTEDGTEDGT